MERLRAALGKKALLLVLCCLYIAPYVNGTDPACLEGFASLARNDERVPLGEGQWIMPSMSFKCDGNITQLMFVARGQGNARLQLQAWRPLTRSNGQTSAYSRATTVDVSWVFTTNSRTTITEILPIPLPVSASYVLGVLVSDTNTATLSAYELDDGAFTMYSIGDTSRSYHTSDLATSTDRSAYVSVSFELSPTQIAPVMTSSSPVADIAPSSSAADIAPSSSTADIAPSSSAADIAPSSSAADIAPSSSAADIAPSSSAADMAPSSSPVAEMAPSSSTAAESPHDGRSNSTAGAVGSVFQGSVFPDGAIAGIVLAVCLLLVAVVMGMICFGVLFSRRSAKRRLDHSSYTSAVFCKDSGEVMLLRSSSLASSVAEISPYEVSDFSRTTGTGSAPAFPVLPALPYEPIAWHQDGLGNEWFANSHAEDGPSHLYEAVNSHQLSAQPLPIYGYVPTVNARMGQGAATELTQSEQYHIYADLESVYEGVVSVDRTEEPFSLPPERLGQLYDYLAEKKCLEIPRNAIRREDALGSGEFGMVYKGVLDTPYGPQDVAAKMLKDGSNDEEKAKFLKEAAIMAQFRHPHIVRLLGAVTVDDPCMLVLEFLPKGDLRKYLVAQRPEPGHLPEDTLPAKLLSFCCDVARGLTYLSNKGFIHRDLAARNILLDKSLKCKIADFGMSKNVESDYYMSAGGKVPIRWTAPECIFYKKYCAGSDVWSFGMLMYEIWSLGHSPFPDLTPMQVVKKLRNSPTYVQPPPPGCPREIYKLMVYCWNHDHHRRPSVLSVSDVLAGSSEPLLSVPEEEVRRLPDGTRATQIGAPLEYGLLLYTNLQQYYNTN